MAEHHRAGTFRLDAGAVLQIVVGHAALTRNGEPRRDIPRPQTAPAGAAGRAAQRHAQGIQAEFDEFFAHLEQCAQRHRIPMGYETSQSSFDVTWYVINAQIASILKLGWKIKNAPRRGVLLFVFLAGGR